ncbi:hypothetical protein DH2020_016536 [Rehmannia glutinosa]|uniref:Uncharacterized protein n=1 Tax=Rehmannia glutinosa TaxID=99300 RepID=A0ABR0WQX8_REHGL
MEKFELENKISENGEEQKKQDFKDKKKKLGGVRTMPFILANEICDRFAGAGFHANMITYLTQVLNLPLVKASNTISNFGGTSSFTPLIGAFLADSFAGRFWTIIIGNGYNHNIGRSASAPSSSMSKSGELPRSLQFTAMGSLPCSSLNVVRHRRNPTVRRHVRSRPIRHEQTENRVQELELFQLVLFLHGDGIFACSNHCGLHSRQHKLGWGLGIPTIAMGISLAAFILGSSLYKKIKPGGSPYVRVAQVIVAAVKKRKVDVPSDSGALYENGQLDARISTNGRLMHSNQFKWLDRAAVQSDSDMKAPNKPNLWRLATVHRVEELKTVVRLLPIWAAAILLVASHSHLHSFTIQQARTMDRHLSPSFQIPPATMSIFSTLTVLTALPLYERLFVPLARRFTKNPVGITCLQRMGIGYSINILASIVSAFTEIKRKNVARQHNLLDRPIDVIPISVFWLVPQYCLHGLAEVFMSVGHLEFLYDQSPESMRSTAAALYWIAIAMGNYVSTLMVSLVHKYSGKKSNWLPDRNLNKGRLENYYWLVTGLQVVNLVYYVICAWFYTYKPVDEVTEIESGDEDVESDDNTKSLSK